MSTQAQLEAYRNAKINKYERQVFNYMLAHPGTNILEMERDLGIPRNTVTARMTGLRKKGMAFYSGKVKIGDYSYSICCAEPTPSSWPNRRKAYELEQDLLDIKKFGKRWKSQLPKAVIEGLYDLYDRVKATNHAG